jgi:hypothetical protein
MPGLLVSNDMLFADSLCQRARMQGKQLEMRSFQAAIRADSPDLITHVWIDLSSLSAQVADEIAQLKSTFQNARFTAFGPHVHEARLEAASNAGCHDVLTRGQMQQQAQRVIDLL